MIRRRSITAATLLIAAIAVPSSGRAGQEQLPTPASEAVATPRADFRVIAWYRLDQPIDTFQYQVYDLRKGDWTPAVDFWVELLRTRYPGYKVVLQDVDLAREVGPTETRKVGAVVHRELLAAAAREGVFLSPEASARGAVAREPLTVRLAPVGYRATGPYLPSIPMMFQQNAAPAGFPVPMPFPRPHP